MHRSGSLRHLGIVTVACSAVAGATSCGTDVNEPTAATETAVEEASDTTSSSVAVNSAATTPPTTTTAETTATTTSTTPSLTTVAEVTTGWTGVDPADVSVKAFPPCCGDTWHGDISPPLAPAGQALADGVYPVAMTWADDPTEPIEVAVGRFERCGLLPEFSCEAPGPGGYGPDDLGVDFEDSRPLTVALDTDVRVVVVGWDTEARFAIEQATGTDFAALAREIDDAYAAVFARPFLAGEEPSAIVAAVIEHPTGGFGPGSGSLAAVAFTPISGPPVLFQGVFPDIDGEPVPGRGVDVLRVHSLEVIDGRITILVYAAYEP